MPRIEYQGKSYDSIDETGIQRVPGTRRFAELIAAGKREVPDIAFKRFDGLDFLTYRGVTLPPAQESYQHARNIGLLVSEMARDPESPKPLVVADIGTGSGVIAITVAQSLPFETHGDNPDVQVVATDISGAALEVAEINAQLNDTEGIKFRKRNLLDGLVREFGKLDVIISNPPYSSSGGINDAFSASDYVPKLALDGGEDSFEVHRNLLEEARTALSDRGILFFEHMSYKIPDLARISKTIIPSAEVLAINGYHHSFTATAVGNPDTLRILQKYSGGNFLFR